MYGNTSNIGFTAKLSHVVDILGKDANPDILCSQGRRAVKNFCQEAVEYGIKAGDTVELKHINKNPNTELRKGLRKVMGSNGRSTPLCQFLRFCLGDKRLGAGRLGRDVGIRDRNQIIFDEEGIKNINKIKIYG